jgi:hypothetical protein|tara:strand:+ start:1852 stop:2076 length:225 start_codon:yes stop_codon:yes gene_type:complete
MLLNAPQVVANCATMGLFVALIAKVRAMSKGTWRQQMMELFLRRERLKAKKQASELQKKLSKDKVNLKGLGEEE